MDIAAHRAHPEVSLDGHVKSRVVELGQSLARRVAIYLDTKFWIILRDCASGRNSDPAARELLERLRKLVRDGKAFCPISDGTFFEFLKNGDPASRLEIARVVDELSLGVALLDHRMRLGTEISHFVHGVEGVGDLHPLHHLVWSKVAFALGFVHPTNTGADAETELAIQKAFFDRMWEMPLEEVMRTLGAHTPPGGLDFAVSDLNKGVSQNADQIKSFAQAYAAELAGTVELGAGMAMDVMGDLFRKRTGGEPPEAGSPHWQTFWNQWANLLFAALKKRPQMRQQLRTLHIHASLHAAFRWDKARRFTSNDLYDFEHASAALAYCRAFLTEDGLHATISARHVALDKLFLCRVASDLSGAIDVLKALEDDDSSSRTPE
ncbi:hypothetical protein ACFQZO_32310 [Bradyrhizobium sp. GCM10027634]|uniref:hypothetical protein n=1 Tax=unclassified Bradyrhizobium TaxID=2631580 RepID=UPI00263A798A|nr:hypothetical protein [Bradyrhizobium sp. WYCCWR 12677]MDN5005544.1 hypothetical protein [Bradyrhizobium sp. WYCCWR 12677]